MNAKRTNSINSIIHVFFCIGLLIEDCSVMIILLVWEHSNDLYLVTDVDFDSGLQVVEHLLKVPCPRCPQVTGIAVRLKKREIQMWLWGQRSNAGHLRWSATHSQQTDYSDSKVKAFIPAPSTFRKTSALQAIDNVPQWSYHPTVLRHLTF